MKKTFDSFTACLELREVIFLRSLPPHPHLVPALDIFLDPYSRRLHIAMEYMDGNLYQLMKARDHKPLDVHSVKSILFQILAGLEHIHHSDFFHRDIKPENILVSTSQKMEMGHNFRRYSALMTPPSTPPVYTIKIADFGLARETHSKLPYTTYVSTRWYRAPEVLLRAGEYSAPVDIWAVGAMAVEIATLKPLFPGGNEVDQVWRVCEIMGSPGSWVNKHNQRVGGGEWKDGVRLAQKLGFSFPKMAPHPLDTILQSPQWPASLAQFVTWCLMWDPRGRPTSTQALAHEFFNDAVDPLRLKSSSSRLLGRKQSDLSAKDSPEASPKLTSKTSSWLRRSLVARESAPAVPQHSQAQTVSPHPSPAHATGADASAPTKARPNPAKRATWTNGVPANGAPIPILPSIRPISPLSAEVTAQASARAAENEKAAKKIGRQLSVASHGNHYADAHRQEAERALNGQSGLASPASGHKEGFFSHLRKRARRLSGRYATPMSPNSDDIEANAGCAPWATGSNRQSMIIDQPGAGPTPSTNSDFSDLDKALQNVRASMEGLPQPNQVPKGPRVAANPMLKRHHSLNHGVDPRSSEPGLTSTGAPISSRTRRALQGKTNPSNRYETPNEEEELLSEVLHSTHKAVKKMDRNAAAEHQRKPHRPAYVDGTGAASYLTPSHSQSRNNVGFGQTPYVTPTKPLEISKVRAAKDEGPSKWPTPPDDNDWASNVAASLLATQSMYR